MRMIEYDDSALNRIIIYIYQFTTMRKKILKKKNAHTHTAIAIADDSIIQYVVYVIKANASEIYCKKKFFSVFIEDLYHCSKNCNLSLRLSFRELTDSNWKGMYDSCDIYPKLHADKKNVYRKFSKTKNIWNFFFKKYKMNANFCYFQSTSQPKSFWHMKC